MFNNSKPAPLSPAGGTVLRQAAGNGNVAPAPEPTAAASATAGSVTLPLTRPIVTHQGPKSEIVIRAPTFTDYIANGDIDTPVASGVGPDGRPTTLEVRTNHEAIMKWASALTGLDRLVLSQLAPGDAGEMLKHVRMAIQPFSQGNSPAAPTS